MSSYVSVTSSRSISCFVSPFLFFLTALGSQFGLIFLLDTQCLAIVCPSCDNVTQAAKVAVDLVVADRISSHNIGLLVKAPAPWRLPLSCSLVLSLFYLACLSLS